jgi:threonine synthase
MSYENICTCGKKYKFNNRLLSHQKTCSESLKAQKSNDYERILSLMKENDELQKHLKNISSNVTTKTITTETVRNEEYDINVFLNENFKDKTNYSDIIDRIEIVRVSKNETRTVKSSDSEEPVAGLLE